MEVLGIRLVGVNTETGQKFLLTVGFVLAVLLLRAAVVWIAHLATGKHRNERVMFWTRQGASIMAALLTVVALLSIWFDDPQRLTTGLGLFSAGLAFALQRVVTALAGYVVIMRGNTFTVGDRITMGGVRGDVIALTFTQDEDHGNGPASGGAGRRSRDVDTVTAVHRPNRDGHERQSVR
jgi:small-conductance mechanosensitive channel